MDAEFCGIVVFMAPTLVLLTTAEAAAALGVKPRTVARWVTTGLMKPARTHGGGRGGQHIFTAEEIARVAAMPRTPKGRMLYKPYVRKRRSAVPQDSLPGLQQAS